MPSQSLPTTPTSVDEDDDEDFSTISELAGNISTNNKPVFAAISRNRQLKSRVIGAFLEMHALTIAEETRIGVPSLFIVKGLRHFAISGGGLLNDKHRERIWPVLANALNINGGSTLDEHTTVSSASSDSSSDYGSAHSSIADDNGNHRRPIVLVEPTIDELHAHREWNQVEMDVHRTLARFPPNISDSHRVSLQHELTPMIVRILWENPKYQYYQGFHDICLTALLVLGAPAALVMCRRLAADGLFHRYLCEPLDTTVRYDSQLIYVLLAHTDAELEEFLRRAELGSMFALSWLLTWFAHSIDRYDQLVRVYDFLLATDRLMPVYLSTAIVLYRSSEIIDKCDCDMASIHSRLSRMPIDIPLEAIIADAYDLFVQYPPIALEGTMRIEYEEQVRIAQNQRIASLKIRKRRSVLVSGQTLRLVLWASTAGAAAYLLSRYGFSDLSWLL